MDFDWTPEQTAYKKKVVEFARGLPAGDLDRRDRVGEFAREAWEACARFGIHSLSIPAGYNSTGTDTDLMSAVLAMEAIPQPHENWKLQGTTVKVKYNSRISPFALFKPPASR